MKNFFFLREPPKKWYKSQIKFREIRNLLGFDLQKSSMEVSWKAL